jgi:hypothetical protein
MSEVNVGVQVLTCGALLNCTLMIIAFLNIEYLAKRKERWKY